MERRRLLTQLAARVLAVLPAPGDHLSPIPGLTLFRRDGHCDPVSAMVEPNLSLVIQGHKQVAVGEDSYAYGAGQFSLAAVDLPSLSQVSDDGAAVPFLSLSVRLDRSLVATLAGEITHHGFTVDGTHAAVVIADAGLELLAALARFAALPPHDIPVMADLLQREIVYRLLRSPAGVQLRDVALPGTHAHRIAAVVAWMRANLATSIGIEELAAMASMAVSTFHLQFKLVTRMSPLQYQKQIRLHEARRILLHEATDASSAAFKVGYESVTQFSREYRRQFGNPPRRDVASVVRHRA